MSESEERELARGRRDGGFGGLRGLCILPCLRAGGDERISRVTTHSLGDVAVFASANLDHNAARCGHGTDGGEAFGAVLDRREVNGPAAAVVGDFMRVEFAHRARRPVPYREIVRELDSPPKKEVRKDRLAHADSRQLG